MKWRLALSSLVSFLIPTLTMGQDIEMADTLRSNGKIYVVVVVLSVILAGILLFLMYIDYRLRKLERNSSNTQESSSATQLHMKDKV